MLSYRAQFVFLDSDGDTQWELVEFRVPNSETAIGAARAFRRKHKHLKLLKLIGIAETQEGVAATIIFEDGKRVNKPTDDSYQHLEPIDVW